MKLSGEQYEKLTKALVDAFDEESLKRMVRVGFNERLAAIAGGRTLTDISFNLIDWAEAQGKTEELILAARHANPGNPGLRVIAEQLHLAPSAPPQGEFERIVLKSVKFNNPEQWRERMSKCELTVCRIEIPDGTAIGTGFLLGPSVVITNYHVMEDVFANPNLRETVALRFDYKMGSDGKTLNAGVTYRLLQDTPWSLDSSPKDELDYALLHVNGTPGKDAIAGQSGAPPRGWLTPQVHTFEIGEPLLIIQHPQGAPLKLATGSIKKVTPEQARVFYSANTLDGSSGSPCFNSDLSLVALHHFRDLIGNEGIIFTAILERLQQNNLLGWLGEQSQDNNVCVAAHGYVTAARNSLDSASGVFNKGEIYEDQCLLASSWVNEANDAILKVSQELAHVPVADPSLHYDRQRKQQYFDKQMHDIITCINKYMQQSSTGLQGEIQSKLHALTQSLLEIDNLIDLICQ